MSNIQIRTRNGIYAVELDDSDISNAIWLSLPYSADMNMLGSEIYFEYPLDCDIKGEMTTNLEKGDVAYWKKANALCLFFGPTPLSGENGKPVSPFPVVKIGRILGDFGNLEHAGDRTKITVERTF